MRIFQLYDAVFDAHGNIKVCGRQTCQELIIACQQASQEPRDFGNATTGMMNVNNIKEFIGSIRMRA